MTRSWAPLWAVLLAGCLIPDAIVDDYLDRDGDGQRTTVGGHGSDCDDGRADVYVGAPELCDAVDNDCNGADDDDPVEGELFFEDADGDGHGGGVGVRSCAQPEGWLATHTDCDDAEATVHDEHPERCGDGLDNDCDGDVDNADEVSWWLDLDDDGYGTTTREPQRSCEAVLNRSMVDGDCNDTDPHVFPGGVEVFYDGVDGDCDGGSDFDRDGDGYEIDPGQLEAPVAGYAPDRLRLDCDDSRADVRPGAEDAPYDGLDADCGGEDDYDLDGDGHRSVLWGGDDCDDADAQRSPSAVDTPYDGFDADCDPSNDDDLDGDGVGHPDLGGSDCDDGNAEVWVSCASCEDADGDGAWVGCDAYTTHREDCDDADPARPFGAELPGDGVDSDCDGVDFAANAAAGVFVSNGGADHAGCGQPGDPCETLVYAAGIAAPASLPLLVAGGVYEGGLVETSVHGGFRASDWAHDPVAFPTFVRPPATDDTALLVRGEDLSVSSLHLSSPGVRDGMWFLRVFATGRAHIRDVHVDGTGVVDSCTGMELDGALVVVESSSVLDCTGEANTGVAIGYRLGVRGGDAVVDGLTVRAGSATAAEADALRFHGNRLDVVNTDLWSGGQRLVYGLLADGRYGSNVELSLRDSEVAVIAGSGRDVAMGLRAVGPVSVARSEVVVEHAVGVGAPELEARGLLVVAQAGDDGVVDVAGNLVARYTTLVAGDVVAIQAGGRATLDSTVVVSSRSAVSASEVVLDHTVLDAPCVTTGCVGEFALCDWPGCVSVMGGVLGNAELLGSFVPGPTSPCVDGGGTPTLDDLAALDPDLRGTPRLGPWDVGALQSP